MGNRLHLGRGLASLGMELVDVISNGGAFADGVWHHEPGETRQVLALVQQVDPATLDPSVDGDGVEASILIQTTDAPLSATHEESQSAGDVVRWKGQLWRVIQAGDWQRNGYYNQLGVRFDGF
jgi:hypothetical protein